MHASHFCNCQSMVESMVTLAFVAGALHWQRLGVGPVVSAARRSAGDVVHTVEVVTNHGGQAKTTSRLDPTLSLSASLSSICWVGRHRGSNFVDRHIVATPSHLS
jgi:hypothetical protein